MLRIMHTTGLRDYIMCKYYITMLAPSNAVYLQLTTTLGRQTAKITCIRSS